MSGENIGDVNVEQQNQIYKEIMFQQQKKKIELEKEEKNRKYLPQIEVFLDSNALVDADFEDLANLLFYKPVICRVHLPYVVVEELDKLEKRFKGNDELKYVKIKGVHYILDKCAERSLDANLVIGEQMDQRQFGPNPDDRIYEFVKQIVLSKDRKLIEERKLLMFLITNDRNMRVKCQSLHKDGLFVGKGIGEFLKKTINNLVQECLKED